MKIYHYDPFGLLLCETEAIESPKEKGVFLVPANATTIKPDEDIKAGYANRFIKGKWEVQRFYNFEKAFDADNDYAEVLAIGFEERNIVLEIPEIIKEERRAKKEEEKKEKEKQTLIYENMAFLSSTDNDIIRHISGETILETKEYNELIEKRKTAREIVKSNKILIKKEKTV